MKSMRKGEARVDLSYSSDTTKTHLADANTTARFSKFGATRDTVFLDSNMVWLQLPVTAIKSECDKDKGRTLVITCLHTTQLQPPRVIPTYRSSCKRASPRRTHTTSLSNTKPSLLNKEKNTISCLCKETLTSFETNTWGG